ncbi:lytic transglycosylase domain-containing protein [Xanthobacter sp. DSM 14520]|uniref:lytic transglycosylase domain-containing protein n=1 Tax=Xanthobacter autotrophicus (strain ATCC BAA-1158 / Py2) TaxID=78245 RepID=UPI00372836DD
MIPAASPRFRRAGRIIAAAVLALLGAGPAFGQSTGEAAPDKPAAASPTPPDPTPRAGGETVDQAICRLIDAAAAKEGLPAAFLTRLIWRESSFRPHVVSNKGAQGIAQFMPGTAKERGLQNPFDPEAAIPASAALLADLNRRFGNLGLAAAAYNAGPGRVSGFLNGGGLPEETRAYVRIITGRPAEDWAALRRQGADKGADKGTDKTGEAPAVPQEACLATVAALRKGAPAPLAGEPANPLFAPWGVQISGNYSRDIALASFRREATRHPAEFGDLTPVIVATRVGGRGPRTFYRVRLPAQTKAEGMKICDRLRKAGGACLVLPN